MRRKRIAKNLTILTLLLMGIIFLHRSWIVHIYGSETFPFEDRLGGEKLTSLQDIESELSLSEVINSVKRGLEVSVWNEVCSNQLKTLKTLPGFPRFPDKHFIADTLDIPLSISRIGLRIFGYILPKVSGMYQLRIEKNNSGEVEVWISTNHDTRRSVLVKKENSNADTSQNYETVQVFFERENFYYLEVLYSTDEMVQRFVVAWRLRGYENFEIIDKNNIAHYTGERQVFNKNLITHKTKTSAKLTMDPREQIPYLERLPQDKYIELFPKCPNTLNELKPKKVNKFEGRWKVQENKVYIKTYTNIKENLYGGPVIQKSEVDTVIRNFIRTTKSEGRVFQEFNLIHLEKLSTQTSETIYLLEARVNLIGKPTENYLLSQYINFADFSYCLPTVSPDPSAFINIVITVKDENRWLRYFLNNINEIYKHTNDARFGVIIVDFSSKGINMYQEIESTLLIEHYNYIQIQSKDFNKVVGLNVAFQSILNPKDIIFTCDLHLELPMYTLEAIRVHTIRGLSVFSPLVKRLDCGVWDFEGPGWWDQLGYWLVAMYKSDWLVVGGMNNEFGMRQTGEDWDLVDRILRAGYHMNRYRMPGLVHYEYPR